MSQLPRIELGQPIVVPPSEETVYDSGYIVGMGLGTHAIDHQEMFVDLRPYSPATGRLYPSHTQDERLFIPNIWQEAARSGLFAQVMGAICVAANLLAKERRLAAQITEAQAADPEADATALESELAAVRAALQIQQ